MVTFSFNLMAIVCVIGNLFLLTKNDMILHYNKFPNVGAYYQANDPRSLISAFVIHTLESMIA